MKKLASVVMAAILFAFSVTAALAAETKPVEGANSTYIPTWAQAEAYVKEKGWMTGTDQGFAPTQRVNRATIYEMFWKMAGKPEAPRPEGHLASLNDASRGYNNTWYETSARWAYNTGLTKGTGNGGYEGERELTKAETLVILYRFMKDTKGLDVSLQEECYLGVFEDGDDVADWAQDAVKWAWDSGVACQNDSDPTIGPNDPVRRIDLAQMLTVMGGLMETSSPASPPAPAQVLSVQKQRYGLYDWEGDALRVQNEYSYVTLCQEDAAKVPALAEALEQKAATLRQNTQDEFDSLCAYFRESSEEYKNAMLTWTSTEDTQVRRADSVAVSLLSDSYTNYGFAEDYHAMHGTSYDAQTGQELALGDVIEDRSAIPALVTAALNRQTLLGTTFSESAVADYFARTPEDGLSWTLDYNGITFYFNEPGDLAEDGPNSACATIPFAGHEGLFRDKYRAVPEAYMVELPMGGAFLTDLDGDGVPGELVVSANREKSFADESNPGDYVGFGIYTGRYDTFYYEDLPAYGFQPYYVKTASGGHYLYLFCKEGEEAEPVFTLRVFDLSGGKATNVGKLYARPGYIADDLYRVPTDPGLFYLDDFDSTERMEPFAVGQSGVPEPSYGEASDE